MFPILGTNLWFLLCCNLQNTSACKTQDIHAASAVHRRRKSSITAAAAGVWLAVGPLYGQSSRENNLCLLQAAPPGPHCRTAAAAHNG